VNVDNEEIELIFGDYFTKYIKKKHVAIDGKWLNGSDINGQYTQQNQKAILNTYLELLRKGTKLILIIILIFSACKGLELDVSTLIASLGVGSLAIGLATQDTIKNFISGLLIVSDKPFRLGDYIKILETNIEGHVVDIGVRSTKILTLDNNIIIVPNSTLTEKSIENLHYPTPLIKGRVEVGVAYSSDIELVKKAIWEAISEVNTILDIPKPSINFVNFGDSSLDFLVFFYVRRRDVLWDTQNELREKILEKFRKYNIEIPFPQQDIWFRNELNIVSEKNKKEENKNA
jgi:small-conductance mechanosensitive channel